MLCCHIVTATGYGTKSECQGFAPSHFRRSSYVLTASVAPVLDLPTGYTAAPLRYAPALWGQRFAAPAPGKGCALVGKSDVHENAGLKLGLTGMNTQSACYISGGCRISMYHP
jgi:hypothetical protein